MGGAKVLVTGASGQVGSALVRRLVTDGHAVRVILRDGAGHPALPLAQVEVVRGGFADAAVLAPALRGIETVFHVAGMVTYAPRDDAEVYRVNVDGTVAVWQAASRAGVRDFVFTSSTAAVGARGDGTAATEDDAFPAALYDVPYANSKRLAESFVLARAEEGMRTVAVCPSTITGPGERTGNFRRLLRTARAGRLVAAPSGGTALVDVRDVVSGHLAAWRGGAAGRRYILGGVNLTMAELFLALNRAVGRYDVRPVALPATLLRLARAGLALAAAVADGPKGALRTLDIGLGYRYFSAERARRELGWSPVVSIDRSLADAAAELDGAPAAAEGAPPAVAAAG